MTNPCSSSGTSKDSGPALAVNRPVQNPDTDGSQPMPTSTSTESTGTNSRESHWQDILERCKIDFSEARTRKDVLFLLAEAGKPLPMYAAAVAWEDFSKSLE